MYQRLGNLWSTQRLGSFEKEFKGLNGIRRLGSSQMGTWSLSDPKTKWLALAGLVGLAVWYKRKKR